MTKTSDAVIAAALKLTRGLKGLRFGAPIHTVYNPLEYAWDAHRSYLERFARKRKRAFFLGMNPGPWGMAQTGVPFGEIQAVREFLGIEAKVGKPDPEHPKRPIDGFACKRSEVSGRRLWGLVASRFGTPEVFFEEQFVANYSPLVFMDSGGRNLTPDKLPSREKGAMEELCDAHLAELLEILRPEILVGVGQFAEECLSRVAAGIESEAKILRILHPSPASPAANRGWDRIVEKALVDQGVW